VCVVLSTQTWESDGVEGPGDKGGADEQEARHLGRHRRARRRCLFVGFGLEMCMRVLVARVGAYMIK
jgi:hypothetical protein